MADANTNFTDTKLVLKRDEPKQAGFQTTSGTYTSRCQIRVITIKKTQVLYLKKTLLCVDVALH